MELVLRLLCCYACVASVTSFLWSPWAVIVFDDVSNDEPGNFYTPFMNDRPRGTVDNRVRRPPNTVTQRRPPQRRILPNSLYPPRREIVPPPNTVKYISPYVRYNSLLLVSVLKIVQAVSFIMWFLCTTSCI